MPRIHPPTSFTDGRGTIRDLLPPGDYGPPTEIFTRAKEVRGNHVHWNTTQWVYVVHGALYVACRSYDADDEIVEYATLRSGDFAVEPAGCAHAWRAIEDTYCLVFTQGPRSGAAYESDTERLKVPLL